MRPSTISAFAVGLSFGIAAVVVGLTLGGNGSEHLPACETSIRYAMEAGQ